MKKYFIGLVLLISTNSSLYAQSSKTNEEKTFDLPVDPTSRLFKINLDKGNKLQLEVSKLEDLLRFRNMDSILFALLQDLKPLKDSFLDETSSKRIDYNMDDTLNRKIRLIRYHSKGDLFLLRDGEMSALKVEQDTVNFIGKVTYVAKYTLRPKFTETRNYRVRLIVNNLADLVSYMNGSISEKILSVYNNANQKWVQKKGSGDYLVRADPTIRANANKGYRAGGDFLILRLGVDAQNYKSLFVPSATLGLSFVLTSKNFKREIGIAAEDHFLFERNSAGSLVTFRNTFLTLNLAHGPIKDNDPKKDSYQLANLSFSYLVRRKGDFFDRGTMRISAGTLSLFEGKTKIQPVLYFTHFFEHVTPGIRWMQSF